MDLRVREGGHGEPILLLLHGLGATGDVWRGWEPLLAKRWPGRWLAPDLPGHGGSDWLEAYSFEALAAVVAGLFEPGERVTVLGHSLGGVVGFALSNPIFGVRVRDVIGLGIKVSWSEDELAKAQALARRPVCWFDSRAEAADRYLRVSGLAGLLSPDDPRVLAGLHHENGRWRLAMDPATFAVGQPDMAQLIGDSAAYGSILLARGEHDAMCTERDFRGFGTPMETLANLGHNAHVEDPELAITLLDAEI